MRIFSAVQPTGHAHLGNLFGALLPWVRLQETATNSCYFAIADLHALTSSRRRPVGDLSRQMMAQLLAIGLSPDRSVLFRQSAVAAHSQLHWILSNVTPLSHLKRMTQFKSKTDEAGFEPNLGLFSYPVLQAADILLYAADAVPVGEDQQQHLELARSIAAAFNFSVKEPVLKLPETLRGDIPRVMSLRDGLKKMSKSDTSSGSYILITDSNDEIQHKIKKSKTDSLGRISFDEENRPEISNLVRLFSRISGLEIDDVCEQFQDKNTVVFKTALTDQLIAFITPIRQRYDEFSRHPEEVDRLLVAGAEKASAVAEATLESVHRAIGLTATKMMSSVPITLTEQQ